MWTLIIIAVVAIWVILAIAGSFCAPPPKYDPNWEVHANFNRKLQEMAEQNRRAQNDTRARNGR